MSAVFQIVLERRALFRHLKSWSQNRNQERQTNSEGNEAHV